MKWIFSLIFFWLLFVVSLAGWWLYFGVTTLGRVTEVASYPLLERHQRMLFMEGCVLLVFLICGGLALFYFSYRMYQEKAAKEIFFASFTHDLKTSLFRLQLEAEKLGKDQSGNSEVQKILEHTRKMQLDLENSLDSIAGGKKTIFLETIQFRDFMRELHAQWPELSFKYSGANEFVADRRALHSVFKNLIHNSRFHGEAGEVAIELLAEKNGSNLTYRDDGHEFVGDLSKLGKVYHHSNGGSGFGLYIVSQWVSRMGGKVEFSRGEKNGLVVSMSLPGRVS